MAECILVYLYFLDKITDLADTVKNSVLNVNIFLLKSLQVFIVLKKKTSQMTFLHCYHHGGVVFFSYIFAKWLPGGPISILGVVNSLVHVVMYSYYFFCGFKPELKKSIWWKKHITQLQLAQFAFLMVHFFRSIIAKNCDYPQTFLWLLLVQNVFFLVLFGDFYRKVYMKKKIN